MGDRTYFMVNAFVVCHKNHFFYKKVLNFVRFYYIMFKRPFGWLPFDGYITNLSVNIKTDLLYISFLLCSYIEAKRGGMYMLVSLRKKFLCFRKFDLFRRLLYVYAFLLIVGLIPGVYLAKLDAVTYGPVDVGFTSMGLFFIASLRSVIWLYLLPLIATPSLFGPFLCGVCVFIMGLKCGYTLSAFLVFSSLDSPSFYLSVFLYIALRGFVFLLLPSFLSCVSFALFEPAMIEEKMFGGSLFNAPYYRGVVNVRFLFSLIFFWLTLLFLQIPVSLLGGYLLKLCLAS